MDIATNQRNENEWAKRVRDLEQQNGDLRRSHDEAERSRRELREAHEKLILELRERDIAALRTQSLRKLYLALSQTNQAILQIREEQVLLQKICDVSSEFGEFILAWIGFADPERKVLTVAARSGLALGVLDGVTIRTEPDSPLGQGSTATALRLGRPVISNDFLNDPGGQVWCDRARQFGIAANAAFPIKRSGRTVGVLTVYSEMPHFFDLEKVTLLAEIVASLSFALDALDREAVLRATQDKYAKIFHLSPDSIDLTRLDDGVCFDSNRSFVKLFGYSNEEALGHSTLPGDLGTWVNKEDRDRHIANLVANGETFEFEAPMRRKDGSVFFGLVSSSLLEIAGERYNLSIIRDITGRKLAEQALMREKTFTRALLDNLVEGVVACDDQGKLALFNHTLHQWLGLEPSGLSQEQWAGYYGLFEADGTTPLPTHANPVVRAFNGEVLRGAGLSLHAAGQPVRHLMANGAPIFDREHRQLGAVVVLHDVTEQRRADEAIRKISVAVEQSPVTVVITDADAVIEYVNPTFSGLTGYSASEALGQNPRMLKSGEVPAERYQELWATISRGDIWKGEFRNKKKNGELFWEAATIAPIRNSEGVITNYVAIKEDITEYKRVEQARLEGERMLARLNEELEDRIRKRTALLEAANAELDAFSYSVSHDLRAPLRGIDGFSQALLEECQDQLGPEGQHYLERVRAGTQHMGQLIDDLLKLSRLSRSTLNRQPLDLSAMARSLVEEFRQADPARSLDLRVEDGLTASGDRGLVRSALANLLGNAWKYTSRTAQARIELFRDIQPDGSPAFCVRDNGAGFDMAYAGKLFAAFQRLHSNHDFEGTGIGLAIVKRIIRRHGGQVWARSAVNQGASFFFTLPDTP